MKNNPSLMRSIAWWLGVLASLTAFGCVGGSGHPTIVIDGSSTVYPITEAVVENYRSVAPDVRVAIGVSGTGGGFKKFLRGETDITDASRPIKESEWNLARASGLEFIELPIALDGITVVVSPENDWVDYLTVGELKRIWEPEAQGRITRWNQVRADWPDQPLVLFGPGIDSGTFDYFTQVICGSPGASRGDFTSSEDDNLLVFGVAGNRNALGFFGFAYFEENRDRLRAVPVAVTRDSSPVLPAPGSIGDQTYLPLTRPIFIYVRRDAAERPEVQQLIEFYLTTGPEMIREVGYVPLSRKDYRQALERFRRRETGSVFRQGETHNRLSPAAQAGL